MAMTIWSTLSSVQSLRRLSGHRMRSVVTATKEGVLALAATEEGVSALASRARTMTYVS
jgi:hypothetical protein